MINSIIAIQNADGGVWSTHVSVFSSEKGKMAD